ncbi:MULTISPECIES: hypothetical protein [Mucilaginibacter]|uniref:Uncharacterized protein n=2 Tax=Mucilaginibacter TaxID=423349 RepID=A0A6I4I1T1_9SPHI|nr:MULTISPECIES: hypothetical protein [Mucilaginibacter]NCD67876.1 hypothetical protein [Mucilaginibacter agri]QQL50569.1 hypothetical protein GO620_003695 [Mucilaginibacter ginkgonis]
MKTSKYTPWEHAVANLDFYKLLQYPFEPITDFFESATPIRHLQYLRNWRYCSLTADYQFHQDEGPGKLVGIYSMYTRLLEMLYLLTGERLYYRSLYGTAKFEGFTPAPDLDDEEQYWLWFPDNLDRQWLLTPYDLLMKIFDKHPLPLLKSNLLIVLEMALSKYQISKHLSSRQINNLFDVLEKICSIAWLINQRDADNWYTKDGPAPDDGIDEDMVVR